MLFAELAQLAGQRNAIDGRIVEIAAQIENDNLCEPRVRYRITLPHPEAAKFDAALARRADRRSAGGRAAPWNIATPPVRCPGWGPPAAYMLVTFGTGKAAGPPSCSTWCWSARITTGCITAGSSQFLDPPSN